MFLHDPTLYGANFPYRELPIQNPAITPWQNFQAMKPIQNPYLGFAPPISPQLAELQYYTSPQVPFFPFGQVPPVNPYLMQPFPMVSPTLPSSQFPVNPYFQTPFAWSTPWNVPFGFQARSPF
jgi:hypothetical protein